MPLRHVDAGLLGEVYAAARDRYRSYEQPHQPDFRPRCLCARCAVVAAAEQRALTPEQRREVLFLLRAGAQAKYALTVADLAASDPATVLDLYASILMQRWLLAPMGDAALDGAHDNRHGLVPPDAADAADETDDRQPWPPEHPADPLAEVSFVTSGGVALNPATNRLYAPIDGGRTLAVLDATRLALLAAVPLGNPGESWEPTAVAVNLLANRVYVLHSSYDRGTLTMLDGATNAVLAVAPLAAAPTDLAVDPIANRLYVSQHDAEYVAIVDGASLRALRDVPFTTTVRAIRVNPATNRVYVAEDREGAIAVLDGASGERLGRIDLASPIFDLALDPAAARLYAISGNRDFSFGDAVVTGYHVVDATTDTLDRQVRTAYIPIHLPAAGRARLYLAHESYPGVALVDACADVPLRAWRTPDTVVGLAAHPAARRLYALGLTNLWVLEGELP